MHRVIVIHPDRQHSLQTALALQKHGLLFKYITTVYLKKHSLSSFFAHIAPRTIRNKFLKHKLNELDDSKVLMFCQKSMLALSLLSRFLSEDTVNKYRRKIINSFNKKCLEYCKDNDFDILICYDTLCGDTFNVLKSRGIKLILDMSAPCFKEMYNNFSVDVSSNPDNSDVLNKYLQSEKVRNNLINCDRELATFDFFLSASTYTLDTLIKSGIDRNSVRVIPYGLTQVQDIEIEIHSHFSCTFVGSVTQQKGCHYIFKIAEMMPDVLFNFVGVYDNSYGHIPSNCILHGYLSFSEIKMILQRTDLFLFLSLADGFGFAATEAMAYSIPVVCSNTAGVRDFVKGSGWIVDSSDLLAVKSIITSCINNPDELKRRGRLAKNSVTGVGWDAYGKQLSDFIISI